jgi:flagellin-like hook-associated protein FlgL
VGGELDGISGQLKQVLAALGTTMARLESTAAQSRIAAEAVKSAHGSLVGTAEKTTGGSELHLAIGSVAAAHDGAATRQNALGEVLSAIDAQRATVEDLISGLGTLSSTMGVLDNDVSASAVSANTAVGFIESYVAVTTGSS